MKKYTKTQVLRCGVHRGDAAGSTALHVASKLGYTDMVKLLLQHGADPQIQVCY